MPRKPTLTELLRMSWGDDESRRERGGKPTVHVTSRGGLYVDADELFSSPDVQDTIRKMEKLDVTGRSSGPAGTD
ncbi:MAG: hypothetical protein OXN87_00540 [Chloroflexota bacterium]|nr:hypothetical protein [Chloroflexota bacterium]